MSFLILGSRSGLVRAVSEKGYAAPTPIQGQAVPPILEGRDRRGSAQTGTGKTAGFILPISQRLDRPGRRGEDRGVLPALNIVPTREFAMQVHRSVLVCDEERGQSRDIESLVKREIPRQTIAGYAAELSPAAPKANAGKRPNKRRHRSGSRRRMAA